MTCLKRPGGPLSTGTLVAGVALSLVLTASALSQDSAPATETPDWVAHQIDERDTGRDSRVEMTMRLFDRQGRARERSLVITTLRACGSRGDRLLVRFLSPGDIKGTGLLVWEHPKGEDERFLFLPALGRVRRIAGSEKQESFVGSDLSYEDIGGRALNDYTYAFVQRNTRWAGPDGRSYPAWQLESKARVAQAAYTRAVSLVRKDNFVIVLADVFNRRNEAEKRYEVHRLERVDGVWTAMELVMANVLQKTRTELTVMRARYNVGLTEAPLDLTRFFLEGRAEARMPAAMVRTRWLPSDRFALETTYVPLFRSGRFDQLDEDTAPFNVAPPLPFDRQEPAHTLGNAQGGVRATATTGRVDWSLSAYRGFEPLTVYEGLAARFPRFAMLGGDFETVRGPWGFRGELAAFVERTLQFATLPLTAEGRSLEGGVGLDRKAGAYRVSGNAVFTLRAPRASAPHVPAGEIDRSDLTVVASVDRSFARETRSIRTLAVYNPGDESAFARVIATLNMRDNVTLEGSGGVFTGSGSDLLARFAHRDFFYARLKVFF